MKRVRKVLLLGIIFIAGFTDVVYSNDIVILTPRIDKEEFVYKKGDVVKVISRLKNSTSEPQECKVTHRLIDFYDKEIEVLDRDIKISPDKVFEDTVSFIVSKYGIFKINSQVGSNVVEQGKDTLTFSVLPDSVEISGPKIESPFGIHPIVDSYHLSLAKKIGVKWVRCMDFIQFTLWEKTEPEKGNFVWQDKLVEDILQHDMMILGVICKTPYWASSGPDTLPKDSEQIKLYPPKDWNDFANYVYKMVEHYKGKIDYWEVWNEPHGSNFWRGTPEEYVKLLEIAYKSAKKANPDCKIVGMGGVASLPWLEDACKAGALDFLDILSIHGYDISGVTPREMDATEKFLTKLKEIIKMYSNGKKIPIWNTETAVYCSSFLPEFNKGVSEDTLKRYNFRKGASEVVQRYVLRSALGIDKLFLYYFMRQSAAREGATSQSLLEYSEVRGDLKASAVAYAITSYILEDAKFLNEINLDKYLKCYIFKREDKSIAVLWGLFEVRESDINISINISPDKLELIDIMGNERELVIKQDNVVLSITDEPVFLKSDINPDEFINILKSGKIIGEISKENIEVKVKPLILKQGFDNAKNVKEEDWYYINLRQYSNMGFKDDVAGDGKGGWSDEGPTNDMRDMPTGRRTYHDVPFDIIEPAQNNEKSCIVLRSGAYAQHLPKEVTGIKIDKALKVLYFLHAGAWTGRGDILGKYIIRYNDGSLAEITLIGGENISDWWQVPFEGDICRVVPINLTKDYFEQEGGERYQKRFLRILEWENPKPEIEISGIDFISAEGKAYPILIAISGINDKR